MHLHDHQYTAFSEEYLNIKEASVVKALTTAGRGVKGLMGAAKKGYNKGVKPVGDGERITGIGGAARQLGRSVKRMAGTDAGRKQLAGAGALAGGTGLAAYGAYKGVGG